MLYILYILIMLLSNIQAELFSVDQNYQITKQITPNQLGHIWNYNTYRQIGWNKIYIYTNPKATPLEQHRAAGFLQGYATYADIYSAYKNFVGLDFEGQPYAPLQVQDYLDKQLEYMEYMVKANPDEKFWTYVGYYLEQLRYMHAGYLTRIKQIGKPQLSLEFKMMYYLPSIGDLQDLISFTPKKVAFQRKNCNGYIRLDGDKLYTTHGTHNRYSFLLRTYKFWSFPRKDAPLQFTSFSSRPGDLISKDDFYLLSTGLRVIETSLQNLEQDNLKELSTSTVPSWLRTLVSNHLSTNTKEWIEYFLKFRSGTHNNQWVIVDTKRIHQKSELIVIIEEAFSLYKILDTTERLRTEGYISTYNTPITKQVYEKLGYTPQIKYTYETEPRAIILKRYHPKMQNIEQMKYWLVMNQQSQDEQIKALSPRYDLSVTKQSAFGMTDCKVSSEETIRENYFWAISGPPVSNGRFPPFDWRTYTGSIVPRVGIVDRSDFEWQRIEIDIEKNMGVKKRVQSMQLS